MFKRLLLLFVGLVAVNMISAQSITLNHLSSYQTGVFDEGAAEIVAYDSGTKRVFFTNANANAVTVLDAQDPFNLMFVADLSQAAYGGGVNSVAVHNGIVAVAVQASTKSDNGAVVFWDVQGNYLNHVEVGALPDMVIFTPDGSKVITANEGEPNDEYTVDPLGSVSIIDIVNGVANATVTTLTFEKFNDAAAMKAMGVRVFGLNASVAQDLEPEYIAPILGTTTIAVSCQENNALIRIDYATNTVLDILPLGFKDHTLAKNAFDASDRDGKIDIKTHNVLGIFMPDAIKSAMINGKPYIISANEGDSRDYDGYSEEERVKDLTLDPTAYPDGAELQKDENLGRLKTTNTLGDIDGDGDFDQIYSYGGRSFSIWDATTGALVYDSGKDFEEKLSFIDPDYFNTSNDENKFDSRSDDKGPEPESIEIADIDGKTYAFIGMERIGGIFVYNISDPKNPEYITYVNNRDFSQDVESAAAGDLGPEDIKFIAADNSPNGKALLLVSNEVSGTISIYEVQSRSSVKIFDEEIVITDFDATSFIMPPSPLTTQVVFVGGHDIVQTTPTYGNPSGRAIAKEWNDFIGFTKDDSGESAGWVSVNHEQIYRDDKIGDGGGMTAFRVKKADDGTLEVIEQTLDDGRQGHFFNVDFVNTVGETGMNCGGIVSPDGRIWTAEEWFRSGTNSIYGSSAGTGNLPIRVSGLSSGWGVRDTSFYKINTPEFPEVDGKEIQKFQNFNYMTEIDPKQAKAIRKQYNWGRAGWEGGSISVDGKYVYLGIDGSPAPWVRFTAETPNNFTKGKIEVYKENNPQGQRWIEVPMNEANIFGGLEEYAWSVGATMFMRNEWVTTDRKTGIVYWTETGRDDGGKNFVAINGYNNESLPASYHTINAQRQGLQSALDNNYTDFYGHVVYYDPSTEEIGLAIAGGPYFVDAAGPSLEEYPINHLSNPDGLSMLTIDGHSFLMIQEDLNGRTNGRVPAGVNNSLCELYLLDADIAKNASPSDLIRITAVPKGAEITGAIQIDDNTVLVNAQHPNPSNPFPHNHSLTIAIHGFDNVDVNGLKGGNGNDNKVGNVSKNAITRSFDFQDVSDYALYDNVGKRLKVYRNTNTISLEGLESGEYLVLDAHNNATKIEVE